MGDFNNEIFQPELRQFMDQCDLIDLHEPFSDPRSTPTPTPNTHIRSSHKIDRIFGTDIFVHAMGHGGTILFTNENIADHRINYRSIPVETPLDKG